MLFGVTNVLVMFGGSKDGAFNQEITDLVGETQSPGGPDKPAPWPGAPSLGKTLRSSAPKRSDGCRNGG